MQLCLGNLATNGAGRHYFVSLKYGCTTPFQEALMKRDFDMELFGMISYFIWFHRNKALFEVITTDTFSIISLTTHSLNDFKDANKWHERSNPTLLSRSWGSPLDQCYKVYLMVQNRPKCMLGEWSLRRRLWRKACLWSKPQLSGHTRSSYLEISGAKGMPSAYSHPGCSTRRESLAMHKKLF